MRDHDDLPYIVIERRSAGLGPFLWGVLMGAAAALLLAPRSGAETQEDIRRNVRRARTAAEDRIEAARSTVMRTRERIEDQIGTVRGRVDDVRDRLETRAGRAREIVDDGRRAARGMRDEVERRIHHSRDNDSAAGETPSGPSAAAASGFGGPMTDRPDESYDDTSDLI